MTNSWAAFTGQNQMTRMTITILLDSFTFLTVNIQRITVKTFSKDQQFLPGRPFNIIQKSVISKT